MKNDNLAVNTLRALSLDMISRAKSGHPGMALSSAPIIYTLFTRHLIADHNDSNWINRDRFVLSAGHVSALLYANLHLCGYPLPLEQLKQFRQLGSLTPGHPEYGHTPGVDATSGPLGQGIAQAIGMAVCEEHLRNFYVDGEKLINHYTYVLTGDGCLEEGISQEAISFAGLQKLNKLILLYDRNDCTLDGPLSNSSNENIRLRFEASNWNVLEVKNGNEVDEIDRAITIAKAAKEKPTIIIVHTKIGYGSPLEGTAASHGKAFSPEEVLKTKNNLNYSYEAFEIPSETKEIYKNSFIKRGELAHASYLKQVEEYKTSHPKEYQQFEMMCTNDVRPFIFKQGPIYEKNHSDSTRNESQSLLNLIADEIPDLLGGSADVASSVKTKVKKFSDFTPENRKGNNINFGIREFLMASIQNGILLHKGVRTYVGSFLVFADYMKPAIRMSAMEKIPAVYLFSHDSIAVGEDGPTHEPIEQIAMLRSIPNNFVFRPACGTETAASYHFAFSSINHPTCLLLSRQNLTEHDGASFNGALKGGYVISEESEHSDLTIMASGSEVDLACQVQKILLENGLDVRVVSMPCLELFDMQPKEYQESVLANPYDKRIFIEMAKSDNLYKYAKHVYDINTFGLSAPAEEVIKAFNFTPEQIADRILKDFPVQD